MTRRELVLSALWLVVVGLACFGAYKLAWSQPSGIARPDPRYYWRGGPDVMIEDGGTAASNKADARRNLDIPCRSLAEIISGKWTFTDTTAFTGVTTLDIAAVEDTGFTIIDNNVATRVLKFIATGIPNDTTYSIAFPSGGTAVLTNQTQTVTNKAVHDTSFTILDNSLTSRVMKFQANGVANGETVTLKLDALGGVATGTGTYGMLINAPNQVFTNELYVNGGLISLVANSGSTIDIFPGNEIFVPNEGFFITGTIDAGKQLQFEVDGFSSGATRVLTAPDYNGTIATLAGTESFTNKSLVDTSTFVVDNNVATRRLNFPVTHVTNDTTLYLTVPASGTAVLTNLSQTLANKTFDDTTLTIVDNNVASRTLKFNITGNANNADIVLHGVASADRNDTLPNASTMLAGLGVANVFRTNQTVNGDFTTTSLTTANFNLSDGTTALTINAPDASGEATISVPNASTASTFPVVQTGINLTGQTASIGSTALLTAPGAGAYQLNYYLECTTAGAAGTVLVTFGWTDDVGATTRASSTLALTGTGRLADNHPMTIYVASGNITYSTTVAGASGSPEYALRVRPVKL